MNLLPPVFAAGLVLLSLLTTVRSPAWAPWRLAVLSGEFGHWLGAASLGLAFGFGLAAADAGWGGSLTLSITILAAALFLKPAVQAWRLSTELPVRLQQQLGPAAVQRPPFSPARFFLSDPRPVPVETLSYAPGLALDFYRAADASAPAPCVIVIHGGGWDAGDRSQLPHFNHWLARRGYAVAAISYRLAPAHQWPAPRDDALAALDFLKSNAATLGLDPLRFVLLGRSAGGQIALSVGYGARDPAIRGVIGLYAPSDLFFGYAHAREDDALRSPQLMRQYLGGPPEVARSAYESASAFLNVSPATPPTLLLHGVNDSLVWYRHSLRLDARLAEAGVPRAFVALPWATHAFEFNLHGPGGQIGTYAIEWFLQVVTRPASASAAFTASEKDSSADTAAAARPTDRAS